MRLSAAAKTAIDRSYRHFLKKCQSNENLTRSDLIGFLHYSATKKSVIEEIEALPASYIMQHAFPNIAAVQDSLHVPKSPILPHAKAIIDSNAKKSVNVESKPKVAPKQKEIHEEPKDKLNFIMRLKTDDIRKLRILAAQENKTPQMYVVKLINQHLEKFDFGMLSL
jgi:hypothetical protein